MQTVRPKRKGCKNSNSTAFNAELQGQENVNENSHQGCEVLDFMDLQTSQPSKHLKNIIETHTKSMLKILCLEIAG